MTDTIIWNSKIFLLFLLIGLVLFWPSLNHPFLVDDHTLFDDSMRSSQNLLHQFLPNKAQVLGLNDQNEAVYYRPLYVLLYMVCFLLFKANVFGYHIVNLLLFVASAWFIFIYLRRYTSTKVSILTASLYLIHPIHVHLVDYITNSGFSLQVILMLLSLIFQFTRWPLALIFFIGALLCHESALVLPFYALGASIVVYQRVKWKAVLPFFVIMVVYLWWRMNYLSLNTHIISKYVQFHMNLFEYLATMIKLVSWYLRQLFIGDGIIIMWITPVVRDHVGLWLLGAGGMAVFVYFLFLRGKQKIFSCIGLIWFLIGFTILPFACLFNVPNMVIEPHWFIFAGIGFFMVIADSMVTFISASGVKRIFGWASIVLTLTAWIWGVQWYNAVYSSDIAFCRWWLSQQPQYGSLHMHMARAYFAKGQLIDARREYIEASRFSPKNFIIFTNLGNIDFLEGKIIDAKINLQQALMYEPQASVALNVLGAIAIKEGNYSLARTYFNRSIKANSLSETARKNLNLLNKIEHSNQVFDDVTFKPPDH